MAQRKTGNSSALAMGLPRSCAEPLTRSGLLTSMLFVVMEFSCLRLRQWPVTYLITLTDWIMSCQPPRGRHGL